MLIFISVKLFFFLFLLFLIFFFFFFFSSRRRHTRCSRDWSSDVCSSDLRAASRRAYLRKPYQHVGHRHLAPPRSRARAVASRGERAAAADQLERLVERSEERRVGKECRSRWSPDH